MDLRSFIATALEQIVRGVEDARGSVPEGVTVAPRYSDPVGPRRFKSEGNDSLQVVEFDVAVTVTQEASGGVGGNLAVWGIGFNAGKGSKGSQQEVSRVRFSVPLALNEAVNATPNRKSFARMQREAEERVERGG